MRGWNPLTPLAIAVLIVVVAFTGPQPLAPLLAVATALAAAWASGVGRRVTLLAALIGFPTLALLVLMNGVVAPPEHQASATTIRDAAHGALGIAARLAAAVAALGWIIAAIAPRRLTRAMAERGLPGWAAYVLVASLEAVPQARRRAAEVLEAQRCRGVRVQGGLLARARALAPMAGPLVVSLVTEAEERALALDARGFAPRSRRTALVPIAQAGWEPVVRGLIWLLIAALLAWRVWVASSAGQ